MKTALRVSSLDVSSVWVVTQENGAVVARKAGDQRESTPRDYSAPPDAGSLLVRHRRRAVAGSAGGDVTPYYHRHRRVHPPTVARPNGPRLRGPRRLEPSGGWRGGGLGLFYSTAKTSAQLETIRQYLVNKWGTPA
eukprot:jgi/Mesvir1/10808/Mv21204-RA.1